MVSTVKASTNGVAPYVIQRRRAVLVFEEPEYSGIHIEARLDVDLRIGGNSSSNPKLAMEMQVASYAITRGSDGALTWSATLNLSDGTVPAWTTV